MAQLHGALECALWSERQIVFVMGERPIGKTGLLDVATPRSHRGYLRMEGERIRLLFKAVR